ncbi:MAG: DUF4868 domain-containing protein [Victivallaceae bacterium]
MFDPKPALQQLQQTNFTRSLVTFYVVKRSLHDRRAAYSVKQVELADTLKKRFRSIIIEKIAAADSIENYEYNQPEPDEDFLLLPAQASDLGQICQALKETPSPVTEYAELIDSWLYLILLTTPHDEKKLLAARKILPCWKSQAVKSPLNLFYRNCQLQVLTEERIFQMDGRIDFILYDENIFISNKKNFETAMNFRQGLLNNRDLIIEELTRLAIFDHPERLPELIGDNLRLLRHLAQIQKSGYYRSVEYLQKARNICRRERWNITFNEQGQIIISPETLPDILQILNNDRLISLINQEKFAVNQKQKLVDYAKS